METVYEQIFQKLVKLGIIDQAGKILYSYMKFKVPNSKAMMPLSMDWLADNRISLADPDMEMVIFPEAKRVEARTFQNDYVGVYDTAYLDKECAADQNCIDEDKVTEFSTFLNGWLDNIFEHGYELVETKPLEE